MNLSVLQIIVSASVALVVTGVPSVIAWIRLGPRVDGLEKSRIEHSTDIRAAQQCLIRLTVLQEVAERRLERLEAPLK